MNSKASGGGCEIRTHAPVKANGFQDRLVMTTSITLRVFNFIKNRNPSQGKLRENCEKRFSQSASDDAKNPIKSRVFKKLHKQTKEVFKTAAFDRSANSPSASILQQLLRKCQYFIKKNSRLFLLFNYSK